MMATGPRRDDDLICVGCYRGLVGTGQACPHCQWPMCGNDSCIGAEHAMGECSLLQKYRAYTIEDVLEHHDLGSIYLSILVMRIMALREHNPTKWQRIVNTNYQVPASQLAIFKQDRIQYNVEQLITKWMMPGRVDKRLIHQILLSLMIDIPSGQKVNYFRFFVLVFIVVVQMIFYIPFILNFAAGLHRFQCHRS